jgi:hypothetical protein
MKYEVTEEHRQFLSKHSEKQREHIFSCEKCFRCFVFGMDDRCTEYPAKHEISRAEFEFFLKVCSGTIPQMYAELSNMLKIRFGEEQMTDDEINQEVNVK